MLPTSNYGMDMYVLWLYFLVSYTIPAYILVQLPKIARTSFSLKVGQEVAVEKTLTFSAKKSKKLSIHVCIKYELDEIYRKRRREPTNQPTKPKSMAGTFAL